MIISAPPPIVQLPSVATYWSLKPAPMVEQPITAPTVEQLKNEGAGTFSGFDRAIADKFRYIQRNQPTVDFRNASPYNSLIAQNSADTIDSMRQSNSYELKLDFGRNFMPVQGRKFNDIYSRLLDLRSQAGAIQDPKKFNIKSATSSASDVVGATAGPKAVNGVYSIVVTQLAQTQQVASGVISDPTIPLGLSGTFQINGWTTEVTPSDTLDKIRDKINYGEDTNHNGTLDPATDVNGDGVLGALSAPGAFEGRRYIPSFYLNENISGTSVPAPSEDMNGNKKLDGGWAQTGVRAAVAGGQLVLTSQDAANINLRIKDTDKILEKIGVLSRNPFTEEVAVNRKNAQSLDAQAAKFTVNGVGYSSSTNSATIGDVSLAFTKTGKSDITVMDNVEQALGAVTAFTSAYNSAIELMDKTISGGSSLSGNLRLQSIYSDTVAAFYTASPYAIGGYGSVADIGISTASQPQPIAQNTLEELPNMAAGNTSMPGVGPYSYFNHTGRVGVGSQDNFKIGISRYAVSKNLRQNPAGVGDLLNYAASRLQGKLDVHLNPDYGTIKFQQDVVGYYSKNQDEVGKLMTQTVGVVGNAISASESNNLFQSVGQQQGYSVVV